MKKHLFILTGFLFLYAEVASQTVSSCKDLQTLFRRKKEEYSPNIKRAVTDSCITDLKRVLRRRIYSEIRFEFSAMPDSTFWQVLPEDMEFMSLRCDSGYAGLPAMVGHRVYQLELMVKEVKDARSIPALLDVPVIQFSSDRTDSVCSFVQNRGGERREILIDAELFLADSAAWKAWLAERYPNVATPSVLTMHSSGTSAPKGFLANFRSNNEICMRFRADADEYLPLGNKGEYIHIPHKSLATENGNTYTGEVVLMYRSWTGMDDMLNARLPMWTKSRDGMDTVMFRTAGMFEIRAFTPSGDTLQLKKGKNLELVFPEMDEALAEYTFYEYDEAQNVWDDRGSMTKIMLNVRPDNGQWGPMWRRRGVRPLNNSPLIRKKEKRPDLRFWDQRFADITTVNKLDSGQLKGHPDTRSADYDNSWVNGRRNMLRLQFAEIVKADSSKYGKLNFSGILFEKLTPALNPLRNVYIEEYMPGREFRKRYIRGKRYNDLDIVDRGGGHFTLVLKHRRGFEEIQLQTYQPWRRASLSVSRTGARRVKYMEDRLGRLERKFDWEITRKRMVASRLLNPVFWSGQDSTAARPYVRNQLGRMVQIGVDRFGLFNCDQRYRMQQKRDYLATFGKDNETLDVGMVQVADSAAKGIFTFYVDNNGKVPFSLSEKNTVAVFVTTTDEKLYVFRDEKLKKLLEDLRSGIRPDVEEEMSVSLGSKE